MQEPRQRRPREEPTEADLKNLPQLFHDIGDNAYYAVPDKYTDRASAILEAFPPHMKVDIYCCLLRDPDKLVTVISYPPFMDADGKWHWDGSPPTVSVEYKERHVPEESSVPAEFVWFSEERSKFRRTILKVTTPSNARSRIRFVVLSVS